MTDDDIRLIILRGCAESGFTVEEANELTKQYFRYRAAASRLRTTLTQRDAEIKLLKASIKEKR